MSLTEEQCYIYNQKYTIPPTPGLEVIVEYKWGKIFSSRSVLDPIALTEVQDVNVQESLNVIVMSKNLEAIQRKEEVVMAISSIFSQQLQAAANFKIAPISMIQDVSFVEGDGIIYRFDIPITILSWMSKTKSQTYFNIFPVSVRVNDGQPDMTDSFTQTLTKPQ